MFDGMTAAKLAEILTGVKPVKLEALALLRRRQPKRGQWFPTDANVKAMASAAVQLVNYTDRCKAAQTSIVKLPPVRLEASIEEWPL